MKKILLCLIFLAKIPIAAQAQIIYSDIVPDMVLSGHVSYAVTIDSPAINVSTTSTPGILVLWVEFGHECDLVAYTDCEVLMTGGLPAMLNSGQLINSSGTWAAPSYDDLNNSGINGHWLGGVKNKYLGVRVQEGSSWVYGWIRLDVSAGGDTMVIKDYACNKGAASIVAGQASATGIEYASKDTKITASIQNKHVHFSNLKLGKTYQVIVTGINGQIAQKNSVRADETVDITNLVPGIYIIHLIDNEININFKVYIQ